MYRRSFCKPECNTELAFRSAQLNRKVNRGMLDYGVCVCVKCDRA